jgi:hypothetical protein
VFLKLHPPESLGVHFCVPGDLSYWTPGEYNIKSDHNTPNRPRATFATFQSGLIPKTPFGASLGSTYGIYILAFDIPFCHLYVGIAAFGGKKPEGILSRIKKHRVKATGAHVSAKPCLCGGVNHTSGWRSFATIRAQYFLAKGQIDTLADARLIVGHIYDPQTYNPQANPLKEHQTKSSLEAFESAIVRIDEITKSNENIGEIKRKLWPHGCSNFQLITKRVVSRPERVKRVIRFWDEDMSCSHKN